MKETQSFILKIFMRFILKMHYVKNVHVLIDIFFKYQICFLKENILWLF